MKSGRWIQIIVLPLNLFSRKHENIHMKKILVFILIFISCGVYSQQQRIVFEYDDSGNRISRTIQTIILYTTEVPADSSLLSVAEESIFNYNIKVYPNPTQGHLTIEIEDFTVESPLDLVVFDRNGIVLQRHKIAQSVIFLDLSTYPASWYMVAFMLNQERRDFKIIKL